VDTLRNIGLPELRQLQQLVVIPTYWQSCQFA